MRIGLDAKRAFLNKAGLGNYSRVLINGLQHISSHSELYLFSAYTNPDLAALLSTPYTLIQPDTLLTRMFPALWRTFGIAALNEKYNLDIYHGLSSEMPVISPQRKTRYVVTVQDVLFAHRKEQFPLIDRMMYRHKVAYAMQHADAVITNSEAVRKDLKVLFPSEVPVYVIYQAADDVFNRIISLGDKKAVLQRYGLPSGYILQVSSFYPRKNHQLTLRGFAGIAERIPHHLVFVGREGDQHRYIRAEAESLGIGNRLHILEHVPVQDLPALYQSAALSVFPSSDEGLGIPVLESMISGTPVITMRGTSMEEQAGKAAGYVESGDDIEGMSGIMLKLILDNTLQNQYIQSGLERAALFSSDNYIRNVLQVYEDVLSRSQSRKYIRSSAEGMRQ